MNEWTGETSTPAERAKRNAEFRNFSSERWPHADNVAEEDGRMPIPAPRMPFLSDKDLEEGDTPPSVVKQYQSERFWLNVFSLIALLLFGSVGGWIMYKLVENWQTGGR